MNRELNKVSEWALLGECMQVKYSMVLHKISRSLTLTQMEHCIWLLTRVWLWAAGVHLDVSLSGDPEYVPLHVDVVLA